MREMVLSCANCEMRSITLFSDLPESVFDGLDFQLNISEHPAQDVLIPQFSKTDSIYTIRKGIVKLESRLPEGGKRIVRLLSPGHTLGLQAWQQGEQPYNAVAMTPVELCRIPHSVIEALQERTHILNNELIQRYSQDCQQADMWITHFSTGAVTRRMAYLLLFLHEIQQHPENSMVQLLGRDDMASILGVRQESISRTISQFKQEGLLTQIKRDLFRMDEAGLKQNYL